MHIGKRKRLEERSIDPQVNRLFAFYENSLGIKGPDCFATGLFLDPPSSPTMKPGDRFTWSPSRGLEAIKIWI